ncbi:MAG TPA: hypothetical protein VIM67_11740 [Terriglobus sp.]
MTTRARIGKMLIGAAVIGPALVVAGLLVESRYLLIHVDKQQLMHWLVLDAAALVLGLLLNRGDL